MQGLDPMYQRGTVRLAEQVVTHLHDVVGPDTEEVAIEGGVMELAERQAVRHDGFPLIGVGQHMSGVQQLRVPEPAECTLLPVGGEDALSKRALVQPLPNRCGRVAPPCGLHAVACIPGAVEH